MRKLNLKYLMMTGCLALVTACQTPTPPPPSNDAAAAKLAEAASAVSSSLVTLAEIQQAALPKNKMASLPCIDCLNMPEKVSVDWSGPVEPLIRQLAQASHYRVRVLGVQPAVPVLVTISAHNTRLADVLRDTGFQCMTKAEVFVFPSKRVIELRYAQA